VPVRVTTTTPVEALDFDFHAPSEQLTLVLLTSLAPEIGTNLIESLGSDW
jgi:hypothetical protein